MDLCVGLLLNLAIGLKECGAVAWMAMVRGMGLLYTKKRLVFIQLFGAVFCWCTGCGLQQATQVSFDVSGLLTAFPACFSMQSAVHCMGRGHTFRCRLACCVTYDQQIAFVVKGPLGIEIMCGLIDQKGVTVIDRLRRLVHQWDDKRIKRHYHFIWHYPFIQSLLLGMVLHGGQVPLASDVTYTYDTLGGKVTAMQLVDAKQGNYLKVLYRYKIVADKAFLASIKILFSLRDQEKPYQGRIVLHRLHFKKLKKPNIQLIIPAYDRKE